MSNIQIFKNKKEFDNRIDKTLNGVTQDFLDANNLTLEILNLINCYGCWNCIECKFCVDCIDCVNCIGSCGANNLKDINVSIEFTNRYISQLIASKDTERLKRNREIFFTNS